MNFRIVEYVSEVEINTVQGVYLTKYVIQYKKKELVKTFFWGIIKIYTHEWSWYDHQKDINITSIDVAKKYIKDILPVKIHKV